MKDYAIPKLDASMKKLFLFLLLFTLPILSQDINHPSVIASGISSNVSYDILGRMCDEAGHRLMGSLGNIRSMHIMREELAKLGIAITLENFTVPGWKRGNDHVMVKVPFERKLRIAALGYVGSAPLFTAPIVFMYHGTADRYSTIDAKGKIVLVTQDNPGGKEILLRYEAIDIAREHGAKAILFINDKPGGQLLCGTGNFHGTPTGIPAFSITFEEGEWLKRLLLKGKEVVAEVETLSDCMPVETFNIVATFPGKKKDKVVIGAHFDSWDLGQGGVDNGVGTALLIEIARILKQEAQTHENTIELVWFNGEELGLWGAKKYVEMHAEDTILAMINMDMTGTPTGFNTMGFEDLMPACKVVLGQYQGMNLKSGISNNPWTNSDHIPFMFAGIPSMVLQAHLDEPMYKYYHDFGDTFDKVNKKYLSEAATLLSSLALELASGKHEIKNRSREEMITFFKKHNLEDRLKRQKEYPY